MEMMKKVGYEKTHLFVVGIISICLFTVGCGRNTLCTEQGTEPQATEMQEPGTQEEETETQSNEPQEPGSQEEETETQSNEPQEPETQEEETETQSNEPQEPETQEVVKETPKINLSELKKQKEEFTKNTSSEITVTQDVLRGKWIVGSIQTLEGKEYYFESVNLGNLTINYDSDSKNSYVKFSNNEFTASYGGAEVYYGDQYYNSMPCSLTISGLYRVVSQEDYDKENNRLCSKIELLITEVSFQYDKKNTQVCNELNSFVGKTTNEKITFTEMYSELSYLTEKQLKEYDLELHEPVTSRVDAMFGFREDGSYGLIYLDTPIIEQTTPLTFARMGSEGKDHLFADVMRMKTRSTVSINNKKVEPGLFFYDIIPHDKETITE